MVRRHCSLIHFPLLYIGADVGKGSGRWLFDDIEFLQREVSV